MHAHARVFVTRLPLRVSVCDCKARCSGRADQTSMPAGPSAEDRAHAALAEQERLREWFVCWLEEEEERMSSQRLPVKKSVDEEAYELDPERAVSFEDIQSVLVRFVMPKSRADLVKLFLRYVRVPIHAQTASQVFDVPAIGNLMSLQRSCARASCVSLLFSIILDMNFETHVLFGVRGTISSNMMRVSSTSKPYIEPSPPRKAVAPRLAPAESSSCSTCPSGGRRFLKSHRRAAVREKWKLWALEAGIRVVGERGDIGREVAGRRRLSRPNLMIAIRKV